jgi:hypothetical protein
MSKQLAKQISDAVAHELSQYKFTERHNEVTENVVGIVKTSWSPLRRFFGGHGIAAVVAVPETIADAATLKVFHQGIRRKINSSFVGYGAYKSSYSFIVFVCPHSLFTVCSGIASELKDKSGLHMNIIQGVILVNSKTKEVAGDYTRPAQHKREYEAVLSATHKAVQ